MWNAVFVIRQSNRKLSISLFLWKTSNWFHKKFSVRTQKKWTNNDSMSKKKEWKSFGWNTTATVNCLSHICFPIVVIGYCAVFTNCSHVIFICFFTPHSMIWYCHQKQKKSEYRIQSIHFGEQRNPLGQRIFRFYMNYFYRYNQQNKTTTRFVCWLHFFFLLLPFWWWWTIGDWVEYSSIKKNRMVINQKHANFTFSISHSLAFTFRFLCCYAHFFVTALN